MKHSTRILLTAALAASILLTGCGSSDRSSRNSSREEYEDEYVRTEETMAEAVDCYAGAVDYDNGFYTEETADYVYDDYEYSRSAPSGSDTQADTVSQSAASSDRMLIRNVSITCETLRFTEVTSDIESQVSALGGYIESKTFYGTGNDRDLRHVTYTIRVSSEGLDQIVSSIGSAAIITNSNENTEDVTLSYADTEARVESLRIEQETLNELIAQADSLDTLLILQNELTNIRYQIESYESQLRVLENLSSMSTLTLSVNEVIEEVEPEAPHVKTYSEKVDKAFHDGLDETREYFQDLWISIVGNIIPIAVIIVLGVAALITVLVIVKKNKKKKLKKAQEAKS